MNGLLLVFGVILLIKVIMGYKKGMVKEIISLVSLLITGVIVALVAIGAKSYNTKEYMNVLIVGVLIAVICLVHHVLNLFFFSLKIVSKIPIIHGMDKLLGAIVGVAETILAFWILMVLIRTLQMGMTGKLVADMVSQNAILLWFDKHNLLAALLQVK